MPASTGKPDLKAVRLHWARISYNKRVALLKATLLILEAEWQDMDT